MSAATAAKERRTFGRLFAWAVARGLLPSSPAADLPPIKGDSDRPPFRSLGEVEAAVARGGLTSAEAADLWECVFLAPADIAALLAEVRANSRREVSFLLHALPAYTGARRGELLRLRWTDVDLGAGTLHARSRKQSRQKREAVRQIDLHPELAALLTDWQGRCPTGQFVLADPDQGGPLGLGRAIRLFWQPLRGTTWCLDRAKNWYKVGFHTYRHSFASNLAAVGVDQRLIDRFMGHSTNLRERYQHLFPQARRAAIESFTFAPFCGSGSGKLEPQKPTS